MKKLFLALAASSTLGLTSLAATPASALIVDISATTSTPVTLSLDVGTYQIEWVGVADGGAYDAWHPSCPTGACEGGWRNSFSGTDEVPPPPPGLDFFSLPGNLTFATALASLAAYQSAPFIQRTELDWNGAMYVVTGTELIAQPFVFTVLDSEVSYLRAGDGSPTDNFGGVSLRVTRVGGVPEPGTWALMILGFGGAGAMLRRRGTAQAA